MPTPYRGYYAPSFANQCREHQAMNLPPSDHAVAFRVAELYLLEKLRIASIAERINQEFPTLLIKVTRETVYPLLQKARELDFLRLVPSA